MSGDVAEWENSCAPAADAGTGATDMCITRGGSYNSNNDSIALSCPATASVARNTASPDLGIRCCL
jgi:hypothetical protein